MRKNSPYSTSLIVWLIFCLVSFVIIFVNFAIPPLYNYYLSLNIGAFLLFGLDKYLAKIGKRRVPEKILYFTILLGGLVGAVLSMNFFHHKTSKSKFQLIAWLLILVHLLLIYYLFSNQIFPFQIDKMFS
ncbi:hypothetical protein COY25_00500 [Candidatus Uhrbacteria bacterium CG_4_10_14_0_2_um_filter_41_7]|uniref:DUF1294 domain-containing protein n=1 Tax=Candidatus Uhrbacteria bacterium CG_4_9_14_3_um_filter_41_35 TaxID=1975034 RepID=A0A2M7XF23_9BACT|nr:MAG: hypothetical protein COV92_03160 [Candidatus Uhrbacteria bacterium CG11_big_fil_rev_8_21_14_0_20_41_9]PIZ55677.1 MAG: hypothetical protein COY25_00500 [Candidatus Uhrbacteria bacterium CG_4_10_14_0_2_um_filter_41_7]PJA46470.1 MAG: hypothetical protein CO173_01755 [Candidatus Uhrbacteria bacterium CG_4_9_14_3_um_filter_41_35]